VCNFLLSKVPFCKMYGHTANERKPLILWDEPLINKTNTLSRIRINSILNHVTLSNYGSRTNHEAKSYGTDIFFSCNLYLQLTKSHMQSNL
jgi:hypothetical protein